MHDVIDVYCLYLVSILPCYFKNVVWIHLSIFEQFIEFKLSPVILNSLASAFCSAVCMPVLVATQSPHDCYTH